MMSWDGHLKSTREKSYIFGVKQNVLYEDVEFEIRSEPSVVLASLSRTLHPTAFSDDLIDRADTGSFRYIVSAVKSTRRQGATVRELMEVWKISKDATMNTLSTTTQLIFRSVIKPTLSK